MVLNILDSSSVVHRGLQEFALEAFCPTLSAFEARILLLGLMHKDELQAVKSRNVNDNKGKVLRLTN